MLVSETIKLVVHKDLAFIMPRGIEDFPTSKVVGTMDVWWILSILNDFFKIFIHIVWYFSD